MDRRELDALAAHHNLSHDDVQAAYGLVDARPGAAETRAFLIQLSRIAGVLSFGAGIVFFVAANWQDFGVFSRFALLEVVLAISVGLAIWQPAPLVMGRLALLVAFVATGALLALFGQTYQTGADLYELFLMWAALGLPLVLASQWSVAWGAWLLVLNISLSLFCFARPVGGWFWFAFGRGQLQLVELLLIPTLANFGCWALVEFLRKTRWRQIATAWLGRLAFVVATAFATSAFMIAIFDDGQQGIRMALGAFLVVGTLVSAYLLSRRRDVLPVAAVIASAIVIGACLIGDNGTADTSTFFALALWFIVTSTVSGRWLMSLVRAWRQEAP
jgi:uncharacterized membrane protein